MLHGTTKIIAIVSFILAFTGTLAFRITLPVIAYYVKFELHAPLFIISLLFVSFITMRSISSAIIGYLLEKFKILVYLPVILAAINAVVTLMYALLKSVSSYIILRGIQGFLNGGTWPIIQLLLALSMPTEIRGRILSIYFMTGSLAIFTSNMVYVIISSYPLIIQLTISSLLFSITSLLSIILIKLSMSNLTIKKSEKKIVGKRRVDDKFAWLVVLGAFLVTFLNCYTMGEFSYIFVINSINVTKEEAVILLAYTGLIGLILSYFISWIADKYSDIVALIISLFFGIFAVFMVSIHNYVTFSLGLTFAAISLKSYVPLSRRIVVTYSSKPSLSIGLVNTLSNVGSSLGQLTLSLLYSMKIRIAMLDPITLQFGLMLPLLIYILLHFFKIYLRLKF